MAKRGPKTEVAPRQPLGPEPAESPRAAWRSVLAVRERLPLWLQTRCAVAPRTLAVLAVVLVLSLGLGVHHLWQSRPTPVSAPDSVTAPRPAGLLQPASGRSESGGGGPAQSTGAPQPTPGTPPATAGPSSRLVVDVAGKVRHPGVFRLRPGARVGDALEAAGGVKAGADTDALNRARVLVDGEHIVVGAPRASATGSAPVSPAPQVGGGAAAAATGAPIALNSATVEQLQTLPGIGPVLAQQIIDFRTRNGGFVSVEQLREVRGIGERRFADIQPRVSP